MTSPPSSATPERAAASPVDPGVPLLVPAADLDAAVTAEPPGQLVDHRGEPLVTPRRPIFERSPLRIGFTAALGVGLAWLLLQALADVAGVLVLVAVSAFLAIGLNPLIERMERSGLSRPKGVAVAIVTATLLFLVAGLAIVPPIVSEISQLATNLPEYISQLRDNETLARLDDRYQVLDQAQRYVSSGDLGGQALGGIVGVGRLVLGGFFSALTVLIMTTYFISSYPSIKGLAMSMVPASRRTRVSMLTEQVLAGVGGYVSGALAIATIAGVSSFVFLSAVGAPYPIALALLVAVLDLIPLIGATLGALAGMAACFTVSARVGLISLAFFVIYQQVENYLIYPRVMKRAVDVPPAATIVAALIGGSLLGIVGALLAIPTTAAIKLILDEVVIPRQDRL